MAELMASTHALARTMAREGADRTSPREGAVVSAISLPLAKGLRLDERRYPIGAPLTESVVTQRFPKIDTFKPNCAQLLPFSYRPHERALRARGHQSRANRQTLLNSGILPYAAPRLAIVIAREDWHLACASRSVLYQNQDACEPPN